MLHHTKYYDTKSLSIVKDKNTVVITNVNTYTFQYEYMYFQKYDRAKKTEEAKFFV